MKIALTGTSTRGGRWIILVSALALSACAQNRYITRPCISAEQYEELKKQEPPKIQDRLSGRADEDIRIVAGSAIRLRSWGSLLLESLEICSR